MPRCKSNPAPSLSLRDVRARVSEPPRRIHPSKGIGQTLPKYPSLLDSRVSPLSVAKSSSYKAPPSGGGLPVPAPRPPPRSLLSGPPIQLDEPRPKRVYWGNIAEPDFALKPFTPVTLPSEAPQLLRANSFARHTQRMQACEAKFLQLLTKLQDAATLYRELQQSSRARARVRQMLANFAPATLERYLSCVDCFISLHLASGSCYSYSQVSSAALADYLFASQSSLRQDTGLHRTSPITAIKSLWWWSKPCRWSELWDAMQSSVVRAYTKSAAIKDIRGSIPIPMALVAAWKKAVCDRAAFSQSIRLFLGTALLCAHGSVRFGDIQRAAWSSLQLSTQGLRSACAATKTTRRGQLFAVTWHGVSGRDTQSSWLLHWLAELAELTTPQSRCRQPEAAPDFLFLNCTLSSPRILNIAPASYATALLHLRWSAQSTAIMGTEALDPWESSELTLRSMKSCVLAAASQLGVAREDRLVQGHHRDSARTYSRNDTFDFLRFQRRLAMQLASAWRPNRSMARGGQAPVPAAVQRRIAPSGASATFYMGVPGLSVDEQCRVDGSSEIHRRGRTILRAACDNAAHGGLEQPPSAMSWLQENT